MRACPTKKNLQLYIAGETLKLREKSDTLEIHTWVRAYVPPPPPLTVTTGKLSLPRGAHHYHKHSRLDPYSQYSSCKWHMRTAHSHIYGDHDPLSAVIELAHTDVQAIQQLATAPCEGSVEMTSVTLLYPSGTQCTF